MALMQQPKEEYSAAFAAFEKERDRNAPSWLPPLRMAAISRFTELGFPTRHDEEWRFTPIGPIIETAFQIAPSGAPLPSREEIEPFVFAGMEGARLVFVNGCFAPSLSSQATLPAGVKIGSLADALRGDLGAAHTHLARYAQFENAAFIALNTAFLEDGAFVHIAKGVVVKEPIHLLYISFASETPTISHPRTLIIVEENAQATIVESYAGVGTGRALANAVTEIVVAENGNLDHYKAQRETLQGCHIAAMSVHLKRDSVFSSHSIALGGAIVRNEASAVLDGEHIECTLNGLYLANGSRVVDNHTAIDHAQPNCASHEVYKGILDGQAKGIFNGKIFVRQDAQKTDAKQTNKTLLLSADATINTKPQLEIYADDVKCTHGATVGQLEAESLFYLRSRGIGAEQARAVLAHAFAADVLHRIKIPAVRDDLEDSLFTRLPK